MRWLVSIGLAMLAAAPGGAVHADPSAPQLAPVHGRREDTQRLWEQLRGLDRDASRPAAPAEPAAAVEPPHEAALGTAGVFLLSIAGGAGSAAGALYLAAPSDDRLRTGLLVTTAITAAVGVALVIAHRTVQAAPAVTPRAIGLAIAGPL